MIKIGVDFDDVLAGFVNLPVSSATRNVVLHIQRKTLLHGDMIHVLQQRTYRHITMMTEYTRCSRYRLTQRCSCECSDRKPMCIS